MTNLLRSTKLLLLMTAITGGAYPLVVTALARSLFPRQAAGSILERGGRPVGSALIGQGFTSARYFHGRPSAAGAEGYDAMASGGSNLGPTNARLMALVGQRTRGMRRDNALPAGAAVPSDLATASASGLDPDISPEAALVQARRVAEARGLSEQEVRRLITRQTRPRSFGILGEPRVNVLILNLALDGLCNDEG